MNTELVRQISKEEIDWVKSKHAGLQKTARRMIKEAIEIGEWFVEAEEGMGLKKAARGGAWHLWLRATFPELGIRSIGRYMRLARGRALLEEEFGLSNGGHMSTDQLTITRALRLLTDRDREEKQSQKPSDLPLAEFTEPLLILRDQLKSYVYKQFELEYLAEQIRFRIKNEKLGRRQIRQAVEWACHDHQEIKHLVLKAFLR